MRGDEHRRWFWVDFSVSLFRSLEKGGGEAKGMETVHRPVWSLGITELGWGDIPPVQAETRFSVCVRVWEFLYCKRLFFLYFPASRNGWPEPSSQTSIGRMGSIVEKREKQREGVILDFLEAWRRETAKV